MARKKVPTRPAEKLFPDEQKDLFEKSYEEKLQAEKSNAVECLGMTFPNDEERRKHFLEKLREKLKDPEFRKIEGFPIGAFAMGWTTIWSCYGSSPRRGRKRRKPNVGAMGNWENTLQTGVN